MAPERRRRPYPTARQGLREAERCEPTPQTLSPSYRLAFADQEFLLQEDMRPVRLQLELQKTETLLRQHGVLSTVVVFGSARIPDPETAQRRLAIWEALAREHPDSPRHREQVEIQRRLAGKACWYEVARRFGSLVSSLDETTEGERYVIMTGGGGGIMEAANRGASDAGAESIGLNIVLPQEQQPNGWITPALCFQFHYFALRKMHFLIRARALAIFPGGFGTLDELFDALTLAQCGKIDPLPILLFGAGYWKRVLDLDFLVEEGTIAAADRDLVRYVETAEEGVEAIRAFYREPPAEPAAGS
ncbi:hypothetical protein SAMN06265365_102393 [Tistlia consotensis]|uniref:AMP nucleosidase n=1 Tax=Tistlia consotensis USBA 355 TaxID=560819 RepID=A0A1Y6C619_9PROT|nr:LOG family protein [Tistlia consotensis]SMF38786.1 hypothetical protein SAMN05428998_11370 [Tistlia consotensis USBA 355]SNR36839.1 hypothetical protein SAMN06265365_102393 [Tistlia consotensis]